MDLNCQFMTADLQKNYHFGIFEIRYQHKAYILAEFIDFTNTLHLSLKFHF